jgi:UrcA family protein
MNQSSLDSRKLLGFALCCAAALSSAEVFSAPAYFPGASIKIKYSSSELERDDGVMNVYRNIRSAARMVCEEADLRDLPRRREYRQCYDIAVDTAVAKIGNARLTALHHGNIAPLASTAGK